MDYEAAKFWFDMVQSAIMVVITLWMFISNRRHAHKKDVDQRLSTINDRVTVAEQKIAHAPDDDDLKRIYDRMQVVSDEVNQLIGEFQAVRRTLELMHEHLLLRQ